MEKLIKDIVNSGLTTEEKEKALDVLEGQISLAKDIVSGKYRYCPKCDDYYLTKCFLYGNKTEEANICVYSDPINSGGNEYERGFVDIEYHVCPKGHELEISRHERRK